MLFPLTMSQVLLSTTFCPFHNKEQTLFCDLRQGIAKNIMNFLYSILGTLGRVCVSLFILKLKGENRHIIKSSKIPSIIR